MHWWYVFSLVVVFMLLTCKEPTLPPGRFTLDFFSLKVTGDNSSCTWLFPFLSSSKFALSSVIIELVFRSVIIELFFRLPVKAEFPEFPETEIELVFRLAGVVLISTLGTFFFQFSSPFFFSAANLEKKKKIEKSYEK